MQGLGQQPKSQGLFSISLYLLIGRGQSSDHNITAYLPGGVPGHQRGTGQSGHIQILPSLYIRPSQKRHGPDNRHHICPEGDSKEPVRHGQPISG